MVVKVLLMIDEASLGGGQQHVLWLAERLSPDEFSVAVASEKKGYLVDELMKRGIRLFPVLLRNVLSISSLVRCLSIIRHFDPDIVHTHGGTAGLYGRVAARLNGRPSIMHTYHGIHYLHHEKGLSPFLFRIIDRFLVRLTDRVVCVTESDYESGIVAGVVDKTRAEIIENGIDLRRFSDVRRIPFSQPLITIGTIGRLHFQKGHKYLLEAFADVHRRNERTRLLVIGDGRLGAELAQMAKSLGVESSVDFCGERTDIPEQLAAMDIFVLPSLWEGLPLVLLEAMAAERPIVATAVNGVVDVIEDDKEALLVPPRNSTALAKAIEKFLSDNDRALRCAAAAREKAEKRFSISIMVEKTSNLYREIYRRRQ